MSAQRGCIEIQDLEKVLQLPADDPKRQHLEDCPRCASLLASHQAFMDLRDLPPEAHLEDVDRRLSAALEKGIADGKPHQARTADLPRASGSWIDRIFGFLRSPALRPVVAAAALVVVALGIQQLIQTTGRDDPSRVLRGDESVSDSAPVLRPQRFADDGRVLFEWQEATGAESYRVVFYKPDMMEVARYDAGPDRSLVLDPDVISALLEEHGTLFWGVTALRGLDQLAKSNLRHLELPE